MVQVLPPKTNLGSEIGAALGQGLSAGMQQGMQRGQLQSALGNIMKNPNLTPVMKSTLETMQPLIGLQGGEGLLNVLLPMAQRQAQLEAYRTAGDQRTMPGGGPETTAEQTQRGGGIFTPIVPETDIRNIAFKRAQMTGNAPEQEEQILHNQNLNAWQMNEIARNRAEEIVKEKGGTAEDTNRFMRWWKEAEAKNPTADLDTSLKKAKTIYDTRMSTVNQLKNAYIPGVFHSGEERQGFLKKLSPVSQSVAEYGEEEWARQFLADQGLSPAEISEQFHPLEKEPGLVNAINKLPKAKLPSDRQLFLGPLVRGKSYPELQAAEPAKAAEMKDNLADFIKKNVTSKTSLEVLRDKLWRKRYDWNLINDAIEQATTGTNPLELTDRQKGEFNDIRTNAPRQSLAEIFYGKGKIFEYLRGEK